MKDERTMDADRAQRLRNYLQEKDQESPEGSISTLSAALHQATIGDSEAAAAAVDVSKAQSSASTKEKLHSDLDHMFKDDQASLFRMAHMDDAEGDPGCGDVSFEELFSKFAEMKETAASLPPEQRKAYAEKVTMAFWRAIGGDESEIAGLGDSSDDDNDGATGGDKR